MCEKMYEATWKKLSNGITSKPWRHDLQNVKRVKTGLIWTLPFPHTHRILKKVNHLKMPELFFVPTCRKQDFQCEKLKNAKAIGIPEVASYSGKHSDQEANENLSKFRKNKSPLMVATKAFGMGMDKPNVRFTVNMNYSSSLESFVQEAGRAGRDRKLAVSSILISDYNLVQISRSYPVRLPHRHHKDQMVSCH